MDNKVDGDYLDNELAALRELIAMESESKETIKTTTVLSASSAHSQFSPKEVSKLKELMEKVPQLEEMLQKLLK